MKKIFNKIFSKKHYKMSIIFDKVNFEIACTQDYITQHNAPNLRALPGVINAIKNSYGIDCSKIALKMYKKIFKKTKNTYLGANVVYDILNKLFNDLPLTPIEDNREDQWEKILDNPYAKQQIVYQNRRLSSLFKYVYKDGTIKYVDAVKFKFINFRIQEDNMFGLGETVAGFTEKNLTPYVSNLHFALLIEYMHNLYPIQMPYELLKNPYQVFYEIVSTNTSADVIIVLRYVITPDGEEKKLDKYLKVETDSLEEIDFGLLKGVKL